jgi:hypothetical protein
VIETAVVDHFKRLLEIAGGSEDLAIPGIRHPFFRHWVIFGSKGFCGEIIL